jgi:hypothetical protein
MLWTKRGYRAHESGDSVFRAQRVGPGRPLTWIRRVNSEKKPL